MDFYIIVNKNLYESNIDIKFNNNDKNYWSIKNGIMVEIIGDV